MTIDGSIVVVHLDVNSMVTAGGLLHCQRERVPQSLDVIIIIHPFRHACRDMYEQEHPHQSHPITRLQQGKLSTARRCRGKQRWVACTELHLYVCFQTCVCVCVREMLPLGSQNPCRALAVLLRQPQPSREHHRQRREGREGA